MMDVMILLMKDSSFCKKHGIEDLNMEEDFADSKKPKKIRMINEHHYRVNCLDSILDLQLQKFNNRFN